MILSKERIRFIRFLKDKGCYRKYLTYFNSWNGKTHRMAHNGKEDLFGFLEQTPRWNFFSNAFSWADTKEDYYYWSDLDVAWFKQEFW